MKNRFYHNFDLPDYLEEVLAPLNWSGAFSREFRDGVFNVIMAADNREAARRFEQSITKLRFLDQDWVKELTDALNKYAKEITKRKRK